jgi:hypothetical protein
MTVVPFTSRRPRGRGTWSAGELNQVAVGLAPSVDRGDAEGWEVGVTEAGDPQLYLIGPAPDHDCILCVSRLGSLYVLEDGAGRVLAEHNSLLVLAEAAKRVLLDRQGRLITRLALFWCALRETFQERTEAMIGEGEDLLVHVAPQLAAIV